MEKIIKEPFREFYRCSCGTIKPKILTCGKGYLMQLPILDSRELKVCGECGELSKNWKLFVGQYVKYYEQTKLLFWHIPRLINIDIVDRDGTIIKWGIKE